MDGGPGMATQTLLVQDQFALHVVNIVIIGWSVAKVLAEMRQTSLSFSKSPQVPQKKKGFTILFPTVISLILDQHANTSKSFV